MAQNKKNPSEAVFKLLSVLFFLVLLDSFLIHPLGNIAAMILLLFTFYQIGRRS